MKAGWEVKELSECLDAFKISTKVPKKKFKTKGDFPIISQEADFINGYWDAEEDACTVKKPIVIFGDHTQVTKYVDFDFVVGADGVKVLNPKAFLAAKFLKYFIEANPMPSLGYARHYRHMKSLPIPLPPLEEQKRIVSILDEAFEGLDRARENAEANLKSARELFESYRDSLLNGSSLATLEGYLDNITYGFTNPMPDSDEGPYKITAKNVTNRAINYQTARKTTQEAFDNLLSAKSKPAVGDVLLTKDGTLGRTAVVDRDGICINQSVAVLKPRDGLLPQYLNEILNTRTNQAAMIGDAGGATIKHLYITRIPKINVFVPTIEEQQRLLNELGNFNTKGTHCEIHYRTKLQDISDLRQSLLQKAFTGELT